MEIARKGSGMRTIGAVDMYRLAGAFGTRRSGDWFHHFLPKHMVRHMIESRQRQNAKILREVVGDLLRPYLAHQGHLDMETQERGIEALAGRFEDMIAKTEPHMRSIRSNAIPALVFSSARKRVEDSRARLEEIASDFEWDLNGIMTGVKAHGLLVEAHMRL